MHNSAHHVFTRRHFDPANPPIIVRVLAGETPMQAITRHRCNTGWRGLVVVP
jgi:hypothetical protein